MEAGGNTLRCGMLKLQEQWKESLMLRICKKDSKIDCENLLRNIITN